MCIALTCYYVTIQIPTLSLRPLLRQAARLSVLIIAAIAVMFTLSAKVSLFGAATFPALLAVIAASTVIITVPTWFGILTPSARAAISSRIFHRNNQI
jgi:hypothetical protein